MTIENILENKGATLTKTLRKSRVQKGFMVSLEGYEKQVETSNYNELTNTIEYARKQAIAAKDSGFETYVGVWIENEIAYVDVSVRIFKLERAKSFAKINNQLAIYDIENDKVIYM